MTELSAIIKQETVLLSEFIDVLMHEQGVLKKADAMALPDINKQKIKLVEKLNTLELARRKALAVPNSESTQVAMTNWLAGKPNDENAVTNWRQLMELARRAKQLHELNAQLINLHLQQTRELLSILTQQSQKNSLYGNDGQAAPITGSRIVDSA